MILELDDLSHSYDDEPAVDGVSLAVEPGELVALLGPSGCGKTTLVQAIAGHVRPNAGRVILRGEDATDVPPEARQVGVVFQPTTLYPHMTVGENVGYGLGAQKDLERDRDAVVEAYLDLVALSDKQAAYPDELSGGEQRRVELARALAPQPDLLLLDEPLSALDRSLRTELQGEIQRIQLETGVTTLFVTHDQEEAMALADRIVVMNNGRISGRGSPRELFESPPTPFIASFLGRSNELSGTVIATGPLTVEITGTPIRMQKDSATFKVGSPVTCLVRPRHLTVATDRNSDRPTIAGEVTEVADLGYRYDISILIDGGDEIIIEQSDAPPTEGDRVSVSMPAYRIGIFPST